MKAYLHKLIETQTPRLASTLALAFFLSFLGPYFYFFDLFVHFKLQYALGGLILFPFLIYVKKPKWAAVVILISIISFAETRLPLDDPWSFSAPKEEETYTVVSYNHNYGRSVFEFIEEWFLERANQHDVIVLLEATNKTLAMSQSLAKAYPFQLHQPQSNGGFGMIVLSRYDFIDAELIQLEGKAFDNIALRFQIKKTEAKNPLTVYAMHPPPPAGPNTAQQRNEELLKIAQRVQEDKSENILLIGDLNITPFSKTFSRFLKSSGLKFQSYGLFLNTSWPAFLFIPMLQIPIDHALYSDNLVQQRKEIGPSLMSDHHILIVGYSEK